MSETLRCIFWVVSRFDNEYDAKGWLIDLNDGVVDQVVMLQHAGDEEPSMGIVGMGYETGLDIVQNLVDYAIRTPCPHHLKTLNLEEMREYIAVVGLSQFPRVEDTHWENEARIYRQMEEEKKKMPHFLRAKMDWEIQQEWDNFNNDDIPF